MTENIKKLTDYQNLEKLAKALWLQDDTHHGAAIMVGAGFSRAAAQPVKAPAPKKKCRYGATCPLR